MPNNNQDEVIVIDDGGNAQANLTGPGPGTAPALEKPQDGDASEDITKLT